MKLNIPKTVEVDAKVMKIHIKVCDEFACQIVDQDGAVIKDYEGYVPSFMPGENYGDYLILDIDLDSGMILNWEPISPRTMEEFIRKENE